MTRPVAVRAAATVAALTAFAAFAAAACTSTSPDAVPVPRVQDDGQTFLVAGAREALGSSGWQKPLRDALGSTSELYDLTGSAIAVVGADETAATIASVDPDVIVVWYPMGPGAAPASAFERDFAARFEAGISTVLAAGRRTGAAVYLLGCIGDIHYGGPDSAAATNQTLAAIAARHGARFIDAIPLVGPDHTDAAPRVGRFLVDRLVDDGLLARPGAAPGSRMRTVAGG